MKINTKIKQNPHRLYLGLVLAAGLTCIQAHAAPSDVASVESLEQKNGKRLFDTYCVACHTGAVAEAPQLAAFRLFSPQRIVDSLNSGVMSTQGLLLSSSEMRDVAYYLTGESVEDDVEKAPDFLCVDDLADNTKANKEVIESSESASWLSWGGLVNHRYQSSESVITPETVGELELKWAFGFPKTTRVRSQPVVTENAVYIGSQEGKVYALNPDEGCVYWSFQAEAEVRGSIHLVKKNAGSSSLLFGDTKANAYSVDALNGEQEWKTRVHEHPLATITGSVKADQRRVYVPVSSSEVVPAAHESYACCTFRGALVAVDLDTGKIDWQTFTTPEPKLRGKNSAGVDSFGPSGAPIWSTPAIDEKRDLVIVTTGQNYSSPATGTSDAAIAMDRNTGEIAWISQVLANDVWNGACGRKTANCPEENGPDFDLGTSAILATDSLGKERIFVGQKSGMVFAMDPDAQGKIIWSTRVGSGGTMGGVHWGMTTDSEKLYVGVSDLPTNNPAIVGDPQPGLHALDPVTGKFVWRNLLPNVCPEGLKFYCFHGVSAAVSSSPGLVFTGGLDGVLRAFDSGDGEILWEYSTAQDYVTVNGVKGFGGAIEADGPVIVNGSVFVTSGYDKWGEMPGNVLLMFGLKNSPTEHAKK